MPLGLKKGRRGRPQPCHTPVTAGSEASHGPATAQPRTWGCDTSAPSLCTHSAPTLHPLCTICAPTLHPVSAPTLHPLCTLSAPSVLPLCTQLGSAPYWPCRARVLSPRRRFSRIAVVEARGLAKSATKTVIALSRGSKIKTYRTCAHRWKASRGGRPARTCRPVCRPRLAGARGRPEPGLALAGRAGTNERTSERIFGDTSTPTG